MLTDDLRPLRFLGRMSCFIALCLVACGGEGESATGADVSMVVDAGPVAAPADALQEVATPDACPQCADASGVCTVGSDCRFGDCRGGVCVEPDGPAPTGPVSTEIGPSGGTLRIVDDRHVTLDLTFPADAFTEVVQVRLSPAPGDAQTWGAFALDVGGVRLRIPAEARFTLPGEPSEVADAVLRVDTPSGAAYLPVAADGPGILTAGLPEVEVAEGLFPSTQPADEVAIAEALSVGAVLAILPIPTNQLITLATGVVETLVNARDLNDAVHALQIILEILERRNNPADLPAIRRFAGRSYEIACRAFQEELRALQAAMPECMEELSWYFRGVTIWSAVLTALESQAEPATVCPGSDYNDQTQSYPYLDAINNHVTSIQRKLVENNLEPWIRCFCRWVPRARWRGRERGFCASLNRGAPGQAFKELRRQEEGAGVASDLEYGREELEGLALLGVEPITRGVDQAMVAPISATHAENVHDACRAQQDPSYVGWYLREDATENARADAHTCATRITFEAQSAVTLGGGDDVGDATTEGRIDGARSGRLTISGSVATLRCPDDPAAGVPTIEADELVLEVTGPGGNVEIDRRRANGARDLLELPFDVSISEVMILGGLDTERDAEVTVELWRESPGCGGLFGGPRTRLAQTVVQFCVPTPPALYCVRTLDGIYAQAINDRGQAVGAASAEPSRLAVWSGGVTRLVDPPAPGEHLRFNRVESQGFDDAGNLVATWTLPDGSSHFTRWHHETGAHTEIGPCCHFSVRGLDDTGRALLQFDDAHAELWSAAGTNRLVLPGATAVNAQWLTRGGVAAGTFTTMRVDALGVPQVDAFTWRDGVVTTMDLADCMPGDQGQELIRDVDDRGRLVVVGQCMGGPWLWDERLGLSGLAPCSRRAVMMDDAGDVVCTVDDTPDPFVLRTADGAIHPLSQVAGLPEGSVVPVDLNARGQILATDRTRSVSLILTPP